MDIVYVCAVCAHLSPRDEGRCPKCGGSLARVSAPSADGVDPGLPPGWSARPATPKPVPSPPPPATVPPSVPHPAGSSSGDLRSCVGCGYETADRLRRCPRCGASLQAGRSTRALGWVLAMIGGGLAAGMAWLTLHLAQIMAQSDKPGATVRFTGGFWDKVFVFGILGAVFLFGCGSLTAGVWQICSGKRNIRILQFVVFMALALLVIGTLAPIVDAVRK